MHKRFAAIGLAILFMWPGNCVAQSVAPGPVRVGDRWLYDVKDEATGDLRFAVTHVVVEVTNKEITIRALAKGRDRAQTLVYDLDWSLIDDGNWKYRPSDGSGIQAPLQVAKTWRFENQSTHYQTGASLRTTGQSKVVGNEKVTTNADTFDTFKIETTRRLINANDQTKSTTLNLTTWYAPTINRWVRRILKSYSDGRLRDSVELELTEHSRKP